MMIDFTHDPYRFLYRVAAIIVDDGQVLLCQSHDAPYFWFLPGGRAEMMESSPETLRREMMEELGSAVEIGPLLFLVENFVTLGDRQVHEIGLFYQTSLLDPAVLTKDRTWSGVVDGPSRLDFRWFPLNHLDQIALRPPFLHEALPAAPQGFRHIINRS